MSANENPTRSNDGQYGGKRLAAAGTWSQSVDAPTNALAHINAIVPTTGTAVIIDSVTGNISNLAGASIEKPLLGRFSAITLNASSGECIVYFG